MGNDVVMTEGAYGKMGEPILVESMRDGTRSRDDTNLVFVNPTDHTLTP